MAYMNQEIKSKIVEQVAPLLKKHGLKGSFKVDNYTKIILAIRAGGVDFGPKDETFRGNEIERKKGWVSDEVKSKALAIISELETAMRLPSYFDNTDMYSDYFHTAYYYAVTVGSWDKAYIRS
tara:strand:+ start:6641 stop:7009 length:369 start_codon:yes stop_codon:yes gene_type:complete